MSSTIISNPTIGEEGGKEINKEVFSSKRLSEEDSNNVRSIGCVRLLIDTCTRVAYRGMYQ